MRSCSACGLQHVFLILECVCKAIGLKLECRRCVIVLLSHAATEGNVEVIGQWLLREIPDSANF